MEGAWRREFTFFSPSGSTQEKRLLPLIWGKVVAEAYWRGCRDWREMGIRVAWEVYWRGSRDWQEMGIRAIAGSYWRGSRDWLEMGIGLIRWGGMTNHNKWGLPERDENSNFVIKKRFIK